LLVLAGKNGGEGKSLAIAWLLAQLPGRWISCAELAQVQSSKYDRSELTEPETLAIDDAGTEPLTEWIRGRIYDVVSDRIGNGKRTVITTNIADWAVFANRYDDRLERRITESGRWINLGKWAS
jgi:DNA replication protein DnaC